MRSALALLAGLITAATPAALAQDGVATHSSIRALNLARNAAVQRNGGLGVYRPAQCMYDTDSAGNQCLLSRDASGYTFRFLGGPPGWQQLGLPATTETEIRVAADGRSVLEILYNGAPR
jgi:hypothetical protein